MLDFFKKLFKLRRSVRAKKSFRRLVRNRSVGISFVPDPRRTIYIEPVSLCNLNCVFCAYGKKTIQKGVVTLDDFRRRVEDAAVAGYRDIGLTPITGDVFMDKGFISKLEFLEHFGGIDSFHFYTNGVLLDEEKVNFLMSLKKLSNITVSVYGNDCNSFCSLTRSDEKQYIRLLNNLKYIDTFGGAELAGKFDIALRSSYGYVFGEKKDVSPLEKVVGSLAVKLGVKIGNTKIYNNWGGLIRQQDVQVADIVVSDYEVPKCGACKLIFSKLQILVDGTVNACACRDVNATLAIGNVYENKISDIISLKNERYKRLIQDQQSGCFGKICRSCDFYESIYDESSSGEMISLETFLENY